MSIPTPEVTRKIWDAIHKHIGVQPGISDAANDVFVIFQEYGLEIANNTWDARDDFENWSAARNKQDFIESLFK